MKKLVYWLLWFSSSANFWLRRRFTRSGLAVFAGAVIASLWGLDTNQSVTYQIFAFLVALLFLAIVVGLSRRYRFSATRILPRFGTVGVPLQYRLVIHNPTRQGQSGFHLWESFADPRPSLHEFLHTPKPVGQHRLFNYPHWLRLVARKRGAIAQPIDLPPLPPQRATEVTLEITPSRRGIIRFTGVLLTCPDPLGLFNTWTRIPLPQSLLILPRLYPLPPIQLPGLRRYQSGGVALASSVGDSEEFRSLRDYRPGDSLRKIHWKSWAKVGKPIVKEEQDEFFVRHALILDTFHPEADSEVLEAAISVAASFAYEVQTQESLLDLMFVGTEAYCFTFGRGLGHTDRMLEILASVTACQERSFDYLTPVVIERYSLLSGCICVLLTWDTARQALVHQLQAMQIPTLVIVITEDGQLPQLDHTDSIADVVSTHLHVLKYDRLQEGLMQL